MMGESYLDINIVSRNEVLVLTLVLLRRGVEGQVKAGVNKVSLKTLKTVRDPQGLT